MSSKRGTVPALLVVLVLVGIACIGASFFSGLALFVNALAPTPTPTPAAVLALGGLVSFQPPRAPPSMISDGKGVNLGAMEYIVSDSCPVGEAEPSGWTKFIAIRLYAENPNPTVVRVPPQDLSLQRNGDTVGVPWGRMSKEGEHCHGDWKECWLDELHPGESCEGWEVFEVIPATNPEELLLVAEWGDPLAFVAFWHLGP